MNFQNNINRAGRSTLLITLLALSVLGFTGIARGAVYVSMMDGSQKNKITRFNNWYEHYVSWQPNGELVSMLVGPLVGSKSRLFIVSSNGNNLHAIARGVSPNAAQQWSPDGKKIAYLREKDYNGLLYVVDIKNGQRQLMSRKNESVESFSWDPDSSSLVYVEGPFNSAQRIWLDGKRKRFLSSRDNPFDIWVSSDGTVAVHGLYAISLYDQYGRYMRSLLRAPNLVSEAKWSPNGRWLAYIKETNKYGDALYVIQIKGKRKLRLGPHDYDVVSFVWTYDSKEVIFRDLDGGWSVDVQTGIQRRLPGIGSDGPISASPDGVRIAYTK